MLVIFAVMALATSCRTGLCRDPEADAILRSFSWRRYGVVFPPVHAGLALVLAGVLAAGCHNLGAFSGA